MRVASLSDRGNVRENNEDCRGVTDLGSGVSLCVLCDGMGGAAGGEIASRLALDTFTDSLRTAFSRRVPRDDTLIQRARALIAAALAAGGRDNVTVVTAEF